MENTKKSEEAPHIDKLLTPRQVADIFQVDPKTVTRWARSGRLQVVRTLGGHRRYSEVAVRALAELRYESDDPDPA